MKRVIICLSLLLLTAIGMSAQSISQYEYWMDDDYDSRSIVSSGSSNISLNVSIASLSAGTHFFNFRAKRSDDVWGTYYRHLIYIPTFKGVTATLAGAEYWIDDDYSNKVSVQSSNAQQSYTIDVSELSPGVHYFNYRAFDSEGITGSMIREMFYLARSSAEPETEYIEYEYWIDNNTANKVTGNGTMSEYMFTIDVSSLSATRHTFNFRAKRVNDDWGPTFTAEFDMTETTAIDLIEDKTQVHDVYNIAGYKVKENATYYDLKALSSGIYIYGGMKILVPQSR